MPGNSLSILSYPDVRDAMDRSLDSANGVWIKFESVREARSFISRVNKFRSLDRKENTKIYQDPTHTLHGRSIYDTLRVFIKHSDETGARVEISRIKTLVVEVIE